MSLISNRLIFQHKHITCFHFDLSFETRALQNLFVQLGFSVAIKENSFNLGYSLKNNDKVIDDF